MNRIVNSPCQRRSKRVQCARTALLYGFGGLVALQVMVLFFLRRYPYLADPEFGRKLYSLEQQISDKGHQPLVLMVGSSRVATGFRPSELLHVDGKSDVQRYGFNFSQVGSGPEIGHLTLQRLFRRGIRPEWILVEYWPPFWAVERYLGEYLNQINVGCLTASEVRILAQYVQHPRHLYEKWLPTQLAPLFTSRQVLLQRVAPSWVVGSQLVDERCRNLDESGWWAPEQRISAGEYNKREEILRKIYAKRVDRYRVVRQSHQALVNMIRFCRQSGVHIAIVYLPESTTFRGWYSPEMLAGVEDYLRTIQRSYRVPVIDARTWVDDSGFMDGQHLLPEGATVFTRRLAREALAPLLAGKDVGAYTVSEKVKRY